MIHVIDNYYAQESNYGYTVVKKTGTLDKEGNPVYATLGYCTKLYQSVELVLKDSAQEYSSGKMIELREAVEFFEGQRKRIEEMMENLSFKPKVEKDFHVNTILKQSDMIIPNGAVIVL